MAVGLREAAVDERRHTTAEVENALKLLVHPFRAELHPATHGHRGAPDQPAADVDAVGADVVERAASGIATPADVLRIAHREGEDRADGSQVTDRSIRQPLEHELPLRVEAVHERLHPDDSTRDAVLDHLLGLACRPRGRLLTEDVLAGVGGPHRPLGVQMIR